MEYEPAKETIFSPGDDPLVNLIYRNLLDTRGIDYQRDKDGYYVSSLENQQIMLDLSDEAYAQLRSTSETELPNECVTTRLKSIFADELVLFYEKDNKAYVKAASSVWDRLKVVENLAAANFECERGA